MKTGAFRRPAKSSKPSASTAQLDQIPPTFYTDAEAALEAGTELEEKAERFAIGSKAEKYFEKSLALYQRAMELHTKGQDAPYNLARVLFLLATDFYPPPKSLEALKQSVALYRQSLSLTQSSSLDGMPSAFVLDVQFNLAVTLLALADQFEHSRDNGATRVDVINEAIILFNSVISGQELVLHAQKMEEETEQRDEVGAEAEAPTVVMGDGAAVGSQQGQDEEAQSRSEYTTSLITPASALETSHNLHLSALALLDAISEDVDAVDETVRLSTTSLQRAQAIFVAFPDGDTRSPDNDWAENTALLRYAPLEMRVAKAAKLTSFVHKSGIDMEASLASTIEESVREAQALLALPAQQVDGSTTVGRSKHRIHSQHLEQMGDVLLLLARTLLFHLHAYPADRSEGQRNVAQQAWNLLGLSSKLFLATLKSLDTSAAGAGSSAVLGASNTSTAATRRRCVLYTSMSTLSLLRCDALFFQLVPGLDEKTREQVVNNGRIYGRKAVTEVGLGWLLTEARGASQPQYSVPHGGLDSLRGEADAILTLLRALFLRSSVLFGASGDSMQEAQLVSVNLKEVIVNGPAAPTWRWLLFSPDGPSEGAALMDQVIGEEGVETIMPGERQFWSQLETLLLQ